MLKYYGLGDWACSKYVQREWPLETGLFKVNPQQKDSLWDAPWSDVRCSPVRCQVDSRVSPFGAVMFNGMTLGVVFGTSNYSNQETGGQFVCEQHAERRGQVKVQGREDAEQEHWHRLRCQCALGLQRAESMPGRTNHNVMFDLFLLYFSDLFHPRLANLGTLICPV